TMLDVIRNRGTRLVHLSIDLVFSGTRGGGHVEDDATDPVTIYGKTMAEAERIIIDEHRQRENEQKGAKEAKGKTALAKADGLHSNSLLPSLPSVPNSESSATILRISLPMGISFNGHAGAIDWIQSRFKKNKPATLY